MYLLTIPTERRRPGRDHPLWWISWQEAVGSLVKVDGVWRLVKAPADDPDLEGFFGGGRVHTVDDDTAAELEAAGFGEWLEFAPSDDDDNPFTTDFTGDFG